MKIEKICIVGGGTSGWLTAAALVKRLPKIQVTIVESTDIPTIGVGESTLEQFRVFLDFIGISDEDWMAECDATYKTSIGFENFFYGEIKDSSGKYHFISEKGGYETPILDQTKIQRKTVIAAFRPNGFEILSSDQKDQPLIPGLIRVQTYLGKGYRYLIDTELGELVVDHTENKFSINTQIFLKPLPEMMVLL